MNINIMNYKEHLIFINQQKQKKKKNYKIE